MISAPIFLHPIGEIRTPYRAHAPYQPQPDDAGLFQLHLAPEFAPALRGIERFTYIYVLFYAHHAGAPEITVRPPWAPETVQGLFATRSPARPNPIGLSIVRLLGVEGAVLTTSGLDAFDGSPILDIKPYLDGLDAKPDANLGWVEDLPDASHLRYHLLGIPH